MPLIESDYKKPFYLFSRHLQTILPALLRRVGNVVYTRERIFTPDDDFLDLDWSTVGSNHLIIISHGLEGDSSRPYVLGMVRAMNMSDWDVLAWNYRGCSGEPNKIFTSYHSGFTRDLDHVVHYALKKGYQKISLIGFSIGGNLTLKYLGEYADKLPDEIKCSVNFSVPCHLQAGAYHLARNRSSIYMSRFIKSLNKKILEKSEMCPENINPRSIHNIKNFLEFDTVFTAPLHGYKSAYEYWTENSSIFYMDQIKKPSLLLSAKNDPFLPEACFPLNEAKKSAFLYLETPEEGGHCGFYSCNKNGIYYSERRAIEFISEYV